MRRLRVLPSASSWFAHAQGKNRTRPVRPAEEIVMDSIIYIVGVVVIVMVIGGYFGLA
jgi:hypothetical protein